MKGYKIMLRNCARSIGRDSRVRKYWLIVWLAERFKKDNIDLKNVKITFKNVAHGKIYSTVISIWERER